MELTTPHAYLNFGSDIHAEQTACVMMSFKPYIVKHLPSPLITDSGSVKEETTILGIPCLAVRPNVERPIKVEVGTNLLLDSSCDSITAGVRLAKL